MTRAAQIPDPSCVPLQRSELCWGLCTVVPKSALELPGASSKWVGSSLLRGIPLAPRGQLVAPELSPSKGDARCNGVGAGRLSLVLWLWQLSNSEDG